MKGSLAAVWEVQWPLVNDVVWLIVQHRAATRIQAMWRGFLVRDVPPPLVDFDYSWHFEHEYVTFDTTHFHGHTIVFPAAPAYHTNLSVHAITSSFLTMNLSTDMEEID